MKRLALAIGVLALLVALAVWRIASEPVPVNFLTPYLEETLSRNREGWRLSVDETVLAWRGWKKPIDLNLRDVEVRDREGDRIVLLPVVSVGLSLPALMQGRVGVRYLEVLDADLVIERDRDGHVAVRSAETSDEGNDPSELAIGVIEGLLAPKDAAIPLSFLEVVRVQADRIVWRDEREGIELSAGAATLAARRSDAGVRCEVSLRLESSGRSGPTVNAVAEARRKEDVETDVHTVEGPGVNFTVSVDARAAGIPVADLKAYWPRTLARGARVWVTENISEGEVDEATAHVLFERNGGRRRLVSVKGMLTYTGLHVRYLSDWPAAQSVSGTGSFDRSGLRFEVASAAVGNLDVGRSTVEISGLDSDDERLRVEAPVTGASNDIGALVAAQSADLATHLALDPAASSDEGTVDLDIELPLHDGLTVAEVTMRADARLPGLRSRNPYVAGVVPTKVGFDMGKGGKASVALKLDLTDAAMAIPRLGWRKMEGVPGSAQVVLDLESFRPAGARNLEINAGSLRASGNLRFADEDRQLQSLHLAEVSLGETQLSELAVTRSVNGWNIEVGGGEIDAEALLETPPAEKDGGEQRGPRRWVLVAPQLRRIAFKEDSSLHDASVRLEHDGELWRRIELSGATSGDGAGRFELRLSPTSDGRRRLAAQADDLGSLLRILGITTEVRGGRLSANGETAANGGDPVRLQVEMRDYAFLRSSLLTRLLTFASLRGFGKLATQDSVAFDYLGGAFTFADGRVATELTRTHGPALGLSITGWVGIDENAMELSGEIVPAYAANRILGKVPLLGTLLSGDGNEGFWAIRYGMRGTRQDPKMEVHTLTSLTPALLRNIFGKLEGMDGSRGNEVR